MGWVLMRSQLPPVSSRSSSAPANWEIVTMKVSRSDFKVSKNSKPILSQECAVKHALVFVDTLVRRESRLSMSAHDLFLMFPACLPCYVFVDREAGKSSKVISYTVRTAVPNKRQWPV